VELEADGVGGDGPARQPRPLDCTLVLLDPLLRCAALVVEDDNALGRTRQVGDDKADARVQLARMPLDLRDNTPWLPPALRLITEAGEVAALVCAGRPTGRLSRYPILLCKMLLAGRRIA
jgi:hypothetical protein